MNFNNYIGLNGTRLNSKYFLNSRNLIFNHKFFLLRILREGFTTMSFYSSRNWGLITNRKYKVKEINKTPYDLALEYSNKGIRITALEVNNVLALTKFNIDQNTLDLILSKNPTNFINLDKNTISSELFLDEIGTIRNEKSKGGVYIWTHIATGSKYVGSSRQLARRLIGYFKGTHVNVGKFLPFLKEEGLKAFTLDVITFNEEYYEGLELCLEQYFLLHSKFNLNTLKVVNDISGSRSKPLYMYTKDLSLLIYSSDKQEDFIFNLGIHHSIFSRGNTKGEAYLNKYIFTDYLIKDVEVSNMTEAEVFVMLEEDRRAIKETSKKGRHITLIAESDRNNVKTFDSIKSCLDFLKSIDSTFNKSTLYKYVGTGKPYKGFIVIWANEDTFHIKDKSIFVSVKNVDTGLVSEYSSLRQAAASFAPEIRTTGQTIKVYAESGRLFEGKYLITYKK